MLSTEEIRGHWNVIQGKLKEQWGQLTDADLQIGEGNVEQLVGRLQHRVGADRRTIEEFLEKVSAESPSFGDLQDFADGTARDAADRIRQGVDSAGRRLQEGYRQAGDQLRGGYEEVSQKVHEGYDAAGEIVRRRPVESVATTFMAGVLTGLFVALLVRSTRS